MEDDDAFVPLSSAAEDTQTPGALGSGGSGGEPTPSGPAAITEKKERRSKEVRLPPNTDDTVWFFVRERLMSDGSMVAEQQAPQVSTRGKFCATMMQVEKDTFFTAVLLSTWDNIVGPRVKQVWIGHDELDDNFYLRLLPFVAKCTLNGEISRDGVGESKPEMKFYVLSELGYIMVTFVFTTPVGAQAHPGLFSLSLILPTKKMNTYLPLHQLCADRMSSLIKKLQVLLQTDGSTDAALGSFTQVLIPFLSNIADIGISSVSDGIDISQTYFGTGREWIDIAFLRTAITSHLQTGGSTIVLGDNAERVNAMIDTLAVFLTAEERRRSRYARVGDASFAPDLVLQGIVLVNSSEELDPYVIMQSQKSSTVINMSQLSVRRTKSQNEYQVIRDEAEHHELHRKHETNRAGVKDKDLFHKVDDNSKLVKSLLDKVFQPHPPTMRKALISQFRRLLTRKALVMVQYVLSAGASQDNPLSDARLQKMKKDLDLSNDNDFDMILAFAEKHHKGMFVAVLGDPAEKQEQLVLLLNNF